MFDTGGQHTVLSQENQCLPPASITARNRAVEPIATSLHVECLPDAPLVFVLGSLLRPCRENDQDAVQHLRRCCPLSDVGGRSRSAADLILAPVGIWHWTQIIAPERTGVRESGEPRESPVGGYGQEIRFSTCCSR